MSKIAAYCRVSTEDQNLDRQLKTTTEYAKTRLDADPNDIRYYRDKSTGTNTVRKGYRDMMSDVEAGELSAIVVSSISRISRSIRDLDRSVERITDAGVELHIVSENLHFIPGESDPYQTAMMQLLGVFAELEASMAQMRTREGIAARMDNPEYHHGPAPLGYVKENGQLIEAENYDQVCAVLELVAKGEQSKRKAARELGSSRATIKRAIEDRPELYGL